MARVQKCRSKKRDPNGGGCGDPQCPEGPRKEGALPRKGALPSKEALSGALPRKGALPSKKPLADAVANKNLDDFLRLREAQMQSGEKEAESGTIDAKAQIAAINKTHLESFATVEDMSRRLNRIHAPHATVVLYQSDERRNSEYGLRELYVNDMQVDNEFRGSGIGTHMRNTILKFADEHNYLVSGVPDDTGDGTMQETDVSPEEWNAHRLAHRQRLERWYLKHGYEYNYLSSNRPEEDSLTGGTFPTNESWAQQFNSEAIRVLRDAGFFIRWPNNEVPENWRVGAKKLSEQISPGNN